MKLFCLNLLSFFKHLFKRKNKQVVIQDNDNYVLMSEPEISTFNLEKHNHIFNSQKNKLKYVPPTITKTINQSNLKYWTLDAVVV